MIHREGLYKVIHSSTYLRVLKLYYTNGIIGKYKIQFEYRNGMVVDRGDYEILIANTRHWVKVD